MPTFEDFLFYQGLYFEVRDIKEWDDLENDFNQLQTRVLFYREFHDDDELEFYRIIRTNWQRINDHNITIVEDQINTRDTKGQAFAEDLQQLNQCRIGNTNNSLDIEDYIDIDDRVWEIAERAKEKLDIEKYESKQFRNGLIYGGIIGAILGAIVTFILKIFGVC